MIVYCESCGHLTSWYSSINARLEAKECEKCKGKFKMAIYDPYKQAYVAGKLKDKEHATNKPETSGV